ncbi:hypothetical protein [Bacillus sp. FJAT-27251]|uniref:hypothetical protein n=1 Tax=Bacillus sp. FJAT-27251 TaxID=1684142 RepID=UPI0006A78352|nr:hypothetical protein [Bacillus sp. FJAT-27251]
MAKTNEEGTSLDNQLDKLNVGSVENESSSLREQPDIVTTEDELEGYVTVRMLLGEAVEKDRVFYRDNMSYFNILIDNNIRKWVCRLGFNTANKYVKFNDEEKQPSILKRFRIWRSIKKNYKR